MSTCIYAFQCPEAISRNSGETLMGAEQVPLWPHEHPGGQCAGRGHSVPGTVLSCCSSRAFWEQGSIGAVVKTPFKVLAREYCTYGGLWDLLP